MASSTDSLPHLSGMLVMDEAAAATKRASLDERGPYGKKRRSSTVRLPRKRIVIIGAGFAGLGAARTLQGAGRDVEVILLEAGDCVGGRARSATLPSGAKVEAGATWFHGVCGNPLYEIAVWEGLVQDLRADPGGMKKHEINWKVDFARPHSHHLLSKRMKDIAEEALERFQSAALELSGDSPVPEASIGDFMRKRFDEIVASKRFTPEELAVFSESWMFREKQQCSFDGFFSTDDVSATFPWEFETLEGPNMPVPGGFQSIAESLARALDIRYNHRVTSIEWGSGGASVSCSNGVELEADAVLVTASVGVLQAHHHTMFKPPLPQWKQAALGAVRLGVADKIFVEFEVEPHEAHHGVMGVIRQGSDEAVGTSSSLAVTALESFVASGPCCSCSSVAAGACADTSYRHGGFFEEATSPAGAGAAGAGGPPGRSRVSEDRPPPQQQQQVTSATLVPDYQGGHASEGGAGNACCVSSGANAMTSAHSGRSDMDVWREEPWIMGRRGQEAEVELVSKATQAATGAILSRISSSGSFCSLDDRQLSGLLCDGDDSGGGGRPSGTMAALAGPRSIRTYVMMWPVPEPKVLGTQGRPDPASLAARGKQQALPGLAGLPSWLHGLHSIRFSPGPDWIQPSAEQLRRTSTADRPIVTPPEMLVEDLEPSPRTSATTVPGTVGAVLWITGDAALEMEQQSEEAVQQGICQLLQTFPAVPLPRGSRLVPRVVRTCWGSDPNFLGSYSYTRAGMDSGDVVDHLAEPLTSEDGLPIIMFAGEATHRHYMGTAHGAYMSGFREASRFLASLEQQEMLMQWSLAKVATTASHPGGPRSHRYVPQATGLGTGACHSPTSDLSARLFQQ